MKNTFGNYVWHYIDNENKVEFLEENHQYVICVENSTPQGSEWHLMMANWYNKDSQLTLREPNGTPHIHDIKKSGFYVIHDTGEDRFRAIYRIKGVRYWTEIGVPEENPEEILTIE